MKFLKMMYLLAVMSGFLIVIHVFSLRSAYSFTNYLVVYSAEESVGVTEPPKGLDILKNEMIPTEPVLSPLEVFLQEQKRRKAIVAQKCNEKLPKGISYEPLIVDTRNKLVLCYIYKSASSSLVKLLAEINGFDTTNSEQNALRRHFSIQRVNSHAGKHFKDFTKFVAVRNPLDRLLSAYRNKFKDASKLWYYNQLGKNMVQSYRQKPSNITTNDLSKMLKEVQTRIETDRNFTGLEGNIYANPVGPTFPEFVKFVIKHPLKDPHWVPYHSHCKVCQMEYDFILKFENLIPEVDFLLQYLNVSNIVLDKVNSNSDGMTTDKLCSYWSTITWKELSSLIKLYATDYSMFEYSYEPYAKCLNSSS